MMNAGLSWVGSANLGEGRFHTGIELGEVEQIPQSLSAGALAATRYQEEADQCRRALPAARTPRGVSNP